MSTQHFKAILQKPVRQGGWTYINIPFDVEKSYGLKGKVPIRGSIDGVAFRSSLMPYGNGTHFLVVNLTIRNKTGNCHLSWGQQQNDTFAGIIQQTKIPAIGKTQRIYIAVSNIGGCNAVGSSCNGEIFTCIP